MDALNFSHSFTVEIFAYFSHNGWNTNVVENLAAL